jgi:8-oxo-dGTP diphosphatase
MEAPELHDLIDETEVSQLIAAYGPGQRWHTSVEMVPANFDYWWRKVVIKASRRGEVVLAIQRPDGQLLLHTKSIYPPGLYRLPSGGLKPGETVLEGLLREVREETGLSVEVDRFLGMVEYEFRCRERRLPFVSYVFLVQAGDATPYPEDTSERITDLRYVPLLEIERVAAGLRRLPGSWADWGEFRAPPHDMVVDALKQRDDALLDQE